MTINSLLVSNCQIIDIIHYCCDRKARAASAQSFTLWQQAKIAITCHDHSGIACSCHIYRKMVVILRAHLVRGESHIQRNANWEVATLPRSWLLLVTANAVVCDHAVRLPRFGMLITLLNYSTCPETNLSTLFCKSSVKIKQGMISVAFKAPLKYKIGNLYR